ncbi:HVA22-like protein h [Leucoagaricus sp. SymC.cos]|nr:HVA22-like protein h [Leucoagaricus sp. SymC.cos]
MYWSVVGAFVAFEYTAEWLISWLPFYWEVKTLFLLYLALPQTQASPRLILRQGSTYIYAAYLQPFFVQNEADLDEGIVQAQKSFLTFIQSRLTALWEFILNAASKRQTSATSTAVGSTNTSASANGNASALQSAFGLWQAYGTSVLNALGMQFSSSSSSAQSSSGAATQQHGTQIYNSSNGAFPASTPYEKVNPSFPEPQHFS